MITTERESLRYLLILVLQSVSNTLELDYRMGEDEEDGVAVLKNGIRRVGQLVA